MLGYPRWSESYLKSHPRGYAQVEQTFNAFLWEHNRRGLSGCWTEVYHTRILRWLKGLRAAQKRSLTALLDKKTKAVFPVAFVCGIMSQCKLDGMPWLAIVFHILFVGAFRHEHVGFFLKRDVFVTDFEDAPAEIYLGGLKTENSLEKGGWLLLPGLCKTLLREHLNQLPYDFCSLFPSYSESYTLTYLKRYASKVGFVLEEGIVVHALRGSGAQYLQSLGWKQGEVFRHCRWTPNSTVAGIAYLASVEPRMRNAIQEWAPLPIEGRVMTRRKKFTLEESEKIKKELANGLQDVRQMDKNQFHAFRICTYHRIEHEKQAAEQARQQAALLSAFQEAG